MGLLINQGNQNPTEVEKEFTEGGFDIIEVDHIRGVIEKIELHKFLADNLSVQVRIIDDPYNNRVVFGEGNFNPNSDLRWTYLNLRKSAGAPYREGEPADLDIEKLLVNKVVTMKLSKRTSKDGKEFQRVTWIPLKENAPVEPAPAPVGNVPPAEPVNSGGWDNSPIEITDEDLPF